MPPLRHLAWCPPPLPAALPTTYGAGGVCPVGSDAFQGALPPREGSDPGISQVSNFWGVVGPHIPLGVLSLPFLMGYG